jgi:DNA-binding NarL/FixJ family response regulator
MKAVDLESPIRIFLLLENRLLRQALSHLCRKQGDFQIVGETGRDSIGPHQICESQCDVVILDFFDPKWLPYSPTHQGAREIKVILIGMENDDQQFLEAAKAGVVGYLLKDASASEVIAAIRATTRGEAICTPRLCLILFQWVAQSTSRAREPAVQLPPFTLRQRQLIDLVAKGMSNKEIANELNLSAFTVRNHVHRILKVAGVGTRREAVDLVQMNAR